MDAEHDARLLAAARSGDERALSELFEAHQKRLVRMVELRLDARLRARLDPVDIVQEAWVDIVKRLPQWSAQDPLPFHVWLRLITMQSLAQAQRRHFGAHMRDANREVSAPESRPSISADGLADVFVASATSPSQAAQREELRSRVMAALEGLGELDREIVLLRHFEGLSNEDAAAELTIEPAAASKRFLRALVRLRPTLVALASGTRGDSR